MHDTHVVPRLRTSRLLLREWHEADLAPFADLNAHPEVAEFLGGALTRAESDALAGRIMARWRADGLGLWAVERTDDGAFLGFCGLGVPAWAPGPETEVGWRLARHAWGAGFATEAARAAVAFAFERLALTELVSYTTVANARSRRVMEKLGMARLEPEAPYDFLHPRLGEDHPMRPHVTYRLTRLGWAAASRAAHASPGATMPGATMPGATGPGASSRLHPMDKDTLLSRIRQAHTPIESAAAALDDVALLEPAPGMDGWTRKDVLAHLEWWSDHTVNVIRGLRAGVDPYPGGEEPWDPDAWNARILAENRDRTAEDVRRGEASAFARLVEVVEGATELELFAEDPHPWLDGTVAETVIEDSVAHYPDHLAHLA